MIDLYNGYCINVDQYSWDLCKISENAPESRAFKNGEKYKYKAVAYCGSLQSALKAFRRRILVDEMQDASMSLSEALETIQRLDEELERFIEKNIPEV